MATTLKVGDPAPDFKLPSNLDKEIALSDFRGEKKVLLIFYPLDFSPVCSVQLPDYQKRIADFPSDVQLLGISRDSVFSHKAWARELGLSDIPLLADMNNEVARKYGVFLEGKGINGRAIFGIDKEGVLRYIHEEAELGDRRSADEVIEVARNL